MKRLLLGHVCIDSAAFICGDPIYLEGIACGSGIDGVLAYETFEAISNRPGGMVDDSCVACMPGCGDGSYPVYAELADDGTVERLIVDFTESDD